MTIDQIDSHPLTPLSVATNGINSIYIAQETCEIIKTDFDFKLISIIGQQFAIPTKIIFYEGSLYVCDSYNFRLQELNEELILQESYALNFKPWKFNIIQNTACVRPIGETFVSFYNLKPFYFKAKVHDVSGDILAFKSWFYLFQNENSQFVCFDVNGLIVEDVVIKIKKCIAFDAILYKNENVIMAVTEEKKLILV